MNDEVGSRVAMLHQLCLGRDTYYRGFVQHNAAGRLTYTTSYGVKENLSTYGDG